MKKILINTAYLLLATCMITLVGCADINDIHQKFLDGGERTYVGKADSLVVNGGHNRVQITGLMLYAKTAEYCIIRWTSGTSNDSLKVDATNWQATDTLKVIINGLGEDSYRFFVRTYDKDGNRSLNVECNGYSYGDKFILSSMAKNITKMTPYPDDMVLTWNVSGDAALVEVQYEGDTGVKTLTLPGNVSESKVSGWKLGGNIRFRTAFVPESGAIDTLYTGWTNQSFPEEYLLDKSKIRPLKLPNDATAGYNGTIEGVFNGVVGENANQFHSANNVGVPQHLTFDLGVNANLTKFSFVARQDGNIWNPKVMQIWGIEDITGAEINLPSANAEWETQAITNGWKLLTEVTCAELNNNNLSVDTPHKIRYIIIRTKQVYGSPETGTGAYVIIREMTLYANDVSSIN
jgi:hypothetical protein